MNIITNNVTAVVFQLDFMKVKHAVQGDKICLDDSTTVDLLITTLVGIEGDMITVNTRDMLFGEITVVYLKQNAAT